MDKTPALSRTVPLTRKHLLFSALALVLVAAMLEGVSYLGLRRLQAANPGSVLDLRVDEAMAQVTEGHFRFYAKEWRDDEVGWRYPPGFRYGAKNPAGIHWEMTFEPDGQRSHPLTFPRTMVAVYGDSFAMGAEVDNHQTFPVQLGQLLETQVENWGVGAWSTLQAVLRFERHVRQGRARPFTVLQIFGNDLQRSMSGYRYSFTPWPARPLDFRPWVEVVDGRPEVQAMPWRDTSLGIPQLRELAVEVGARGYIGRHLARDRFPYSWELGRLLWHRAAGRDARSLYLRSDRFFADPEALAASELVIERFLATAKAAGSRPLLLFIPFAETLGTGAEHGQLTPLRRAVEARRPEVPLVDVMDLDFDRDRFSTGRFKGHASVYGNRIMAEALAATLREQGFPESGAGAGPRERPLPQPSASGGPVRSPETFPATRRRTSTGGPAGQ